MRAIEIDAVFIGSCTNGRIEDLREVAAVWQGRRIAPGIEVLVVPGSETVRAQAVAEGLDEIFTAAGASLRYVGMLDVRGTQRRPAASRSTRSLDEQPELRGQARPRCANASGVTGGGGRQRCYRPTDLSHRPRGALTMDSFTEHTGIAAPLRRSDVDTDQIYPVGFFTGDFDNGHADALFGEWRADQSDFVLNQPEYRDATVLVAGTDFGTGSSREWAVWALRDYGFRAIIAPRFGDIFRDNSLKNGLLTVQLPADVVEQIWDSIEARPGTAVTVDLVQLQVRVGEVIYPFELNENVRWRLLNGYDDISLTLAQVADIDIYESTRRSTLPIARRITLQEARRA